MYNMVAHLVASDIGTRIEKGRATLTELVSSVDSFSDFALPRSRKRRIVRQIVTALVKAGTMRKVAGAYELARA